MGVSRLYQVALFGASVHALAYPGPQATDRVIIPSNAKSPSPTLPPSLPPGFHNGLLRRQISGSESGSYGDTILIAPDNTCGYVSGLAGAAFTCVDPANSCVFIPSSGSIPGAAGCCNTKACGFRVTCMDYSEVLVQSKCDDGCMADTYTAKCTGTDNPYCGTIAFPGGITDYFCGTLSGSRVQSAKTTWDGETDGRTFLTYSNTGASSTLAVPTIESSSSSNRASSTVSSSSSGTVGLGGSSTDSADDTDQPEPKKEKGGSNLGAIIGGAVGGLAVIGLVILGIVWMMRRKRNNNDNTNNTPDTPAMSTAAAAGGPGGGHPGLANSPPPPAPSPGTTVGGGGGNLDPALNAASHNSYYYAGSPDPTKVPVMTQHYPAPASPPPADYNNNNNGQYNNNSHNGSSPTSGYIPPSSPASTLMSGGGYQHSSVSNPSAHPHHMSGQSFTGYPQGQQPNLYGPPGGQPVYEAASNAVGGPQELNANHRGQMHELQ
ncbi:hypothetical protein B0T20DRAFT_394412 [Sordaria brevicollis]|uniref:Uncharacterized protein n=1 Tax=Sordaria brevicollis TaxID=83679 RepID=A0AAE0PC93_SORBR|nr:hypothetical protein B0T20DRAFT_394412 [Sordaria brevicollis]